MLLVGKSTISMAIVSSSQTGSTRGYIHINPIINHYSPIISHYEWKLTIIITLINHYINHQ